MDTPRSFPVADILLLVAIAVSILLPVSFLPIGLLVAGGGYLIFVFVRAIRFQVFPRAAFGAASAAVFIFVFGMSLLLLPGQPLYSLVITIVITVILQLIWMVLRKGSPVR